jgi:hypothetical protein
MFNIVLTAYTNTGGLIIYSAPCPSIVCLSVCICSDYVCRHNGAYCLLCHLSVCCLSACLYLFWRRIQALGKLLSTLSPVCLLSVCLFLSVPTTYPNSPVSIYSEDVSRHFGTYRLSVLLRSTNYIYVPPSSAVCLPVLTFSDVFRHGGTGFLIRWHIKIVCPYDFCVSVCILFWRPI